VPLFHQRISAEATGRVACRLFEPEPANFVRHATAVAGLPVLTVVDVVAVVRGPIIFLLATAVAGLPVLNVVYVFCYCEWTYYLSPCYCCCWFAGAYCR